jgi:hypothetical protein
MEKILLKTSCFLLLAALVISCNSKTKIEISFDSNQKGLLVFDQKDTVKIVTDSVITYEIKEGNHTFVLNKGNPQTINIPSEGGILNLNKRRYVRLYQNFGDKNPYEIINGEDVNVLVIDSLVYVYKSDSTKVVSDELIKSKLKTNQTFDVNSSTRIKLYNADLFIPKDWDYGLTEKMPDSITVDTKNSAINYTSRTKLIDENLFRIAALLSPSNFIIKNKKDIMNNVGDKKVDEEKKKNQMDF